VLGAALADAGLPAQALAEGLRVSRIGALAVACNYSDRTVVWSPGPGARCLLGSAALPPRGVSIWQAH
jgi:beta-galactosidase